MLTEMLFLGAWTFSLSWASGALPETDCSKERDWSQDGCTGTVLWTVGAIPSAVVGVEPCSILWTPGAMVWTEAAARTGGAWPLEDLIGAIF